ncbi:serine/threonine-protein phosphatase, partial [Amycolatopsis mediterranei]
MRFLPEEEQRRLIAACFARSDLTLEELWMRYFALGGSLSLLELDAYLNALVTLPRVDRDMVAHAVNERLDEVTGPARAPYSHSIPDAKPLHGPLRALVDLLEGAHRAPPERLPAVVAEAGRALDLTIGVYLADYDQRTLVPLRPGAAELDIDTTVGGDVYRRAGTLTRDGTLWTVLLDGVERLGVLEIVPSGDADPDDPALREQCRWLAALLGHLITITTQYGDGLDRRRRHRRRGSPAELLWQSLPPLTGATESVVVGVSVQPAYDLCGTVFDYALSEERAQLAMFDAGARTGSANTAVVSALAAHRAARHGGASLGEQFAAVAAELESRPDAPAVNGVLAELDLDTGL